MEEERKSKPNDEISEQRKEEEEVVYKTKVIQFLGRSTPIILQNDNGPCPLLAICNVLLLRNSLNLSVDVSEVSLQKLLALVAEKLIDSNSNVQDKDEEYLINQQQNIADAIDLLPRLATGIDVNVQFRRINDFEFTRECAIFDLLDIGLYHGWIVDPQDTETASAIGSKSYNTLVGELVAFEAGKSAVENGHILEEDFVDFVAATTAALGVPSPCLSRGISFEECPVTVPVEHGGGKGEREESEELMRALNLSKIVMSTPDDVSNSPDINSPHILERIHRDSSEAQVGVRSEESQQLELLTPQQCNASIDLKDDGLNSKLSSLVNDSLSSNANVVSKMDHSISEDSREFTISNDSIETARTDSMMPNHILSFQSTDEKGSDEFPTHKGLSQDDASVSQMCTKDMFTYDIPNRPADHPMACGRTVFTVQSEQHAESNPSNGRQELLDVSDVGSSCLDTTEPIYEGEECVVDSGHLKYEDREPVYEGEIFLAQQADKVEDAFVNSEDKVGLQQCNLIRNFLENSASQLTIYGLFCLQEGLKERELCVFFRNNHFNTLFKFNGDLYILATDQGYINQPDLVWEKLNEVNGDTVFMTGNFTEFNIENQVNQSWNEQNALTSTADYLATLEASTPANSSVNSDLQLAIALQQQEFGQHGQQTQQPTQRSQQQGSQQSAVSGRSRLVTGPQVSRNSQASHKNEQKKEKCNIM